MTGLLSAGEGERRHAPSGLRNSALWSHFVTVGAFNLPEPVVGTSRRSSDGGFPF
jgi:hypothetical protein